MRLRTGQKPSGAIRLAAATAVAAMVLSGSPVRAATYTWVGGSSTNYNDPANWAGGVVPTGTDIALFNTGQANQTPTLTQDTPVGELDFNTAGWQVSGGPAPAFTFTLNGVGGIGILDNASTGTNEISANVTLGASQTWEVATGGTLRLDGILGGGSFLNIGAAGFAGTVLSTGANTYTGGLTVNAGTFDLVGSAGSLQATPLITVNSGGTFEIDNRTPAGGNLNYRLTNIQSGAGSNAASINFTGGTFLYQGTDSATSAPSLDQLGVIALYSGPTGVFTVNGNAGNNSASITAAAINQNTGTPSTPFANFGLGVMPTGSLLVNGTNLGLATGTPSNPNSGSLLITTAPLTVGTTSGTSAEVDGTLNTQVVPFLLGEIASGNNGAPAASGVGGTTFGTPNTFLTYSSTGGLRPLNPTGEFVHYIDDGTGGNAATADTSASGPNADNIYLTANATASIASTAYVNSLVINGAGTGVSPTLSLPAGSTLVDNSNALLFVTSGTIQPASSTAAISFTPFNGALVGSSTTANNINITVLPNQTATINADVTVPFVSVTQGTNVIDPTIVVSGGGTLVLNGNNTFDDGVMANNTNVTFGANGWNPNSSSAGTYYTLLGAVNATVNINGASTIPASSDTNPSQIYLASGSTLNINAPVTFSAGTGKFTAAYVNFNLGTNSTVNVNAGNTLTVNDQAGFVVQPAENGTSNFNVYGTLTTGVTTTPSELAKNAPGNSIMTVYNGGTANLYGVALGDNSSSSPIPGALGAIYLQPGSTFYLTNSTSSSIGTVGTQGAGSFSIGAAGNGKPPFLTSNPNRISTDTALGNDFGYVSVPAGTLIGPMPTGGVYSTSNVPFEIDVAGNFRGGSIGGGNGLLDVNGGTVTVNGYLTVAASNSDQQFGELNLLNGATLTINSFGNKSNTASYFNGSSNVAMSTGPYGSQGVINVINSTFNNGIGTQTGSSASASGMGTFPNNAINLGGLVGTTNELVYALPTGILNIVGSNALVQTSYIQARPVTFNVTSGPGSSSTDFSGEPSAYVNFNGGTLQTNTLGSNNQAGMIAQTVAGAFIYGSGAVLSGGNATGGTETMLVGLFAPPGQGVPIQTLTVANGGITDPGSGYITPPIVEITDSSGFDATGYATINSSGQITGVTITNPGFNLSSPTITFIGGGGTGGKAVMPALTANTSGPLIIKGGAAAFNLTGNFASTAGNGGGAGVTLSDGVKTGQELYSFNSDGTVVTDGSGTGNNPYAAGTYYGSVYPGVRNNTSTYMGPTVIETGALQLTTNFSSSVSQTGGASLYASNAFAPLNNNIPFSSAIVVGDTAADSGATLNITTIGQPTSGSVNTSNGTSQTVSYNFDLAPGLVNGIYTSQPQVLAGFGTVKGGSTTSTFTISGTAYTITDTVGIVIGLDGGSVTATSTGTTSTSNNFGGYPYAATGSYSASPAVNHSIISPGYTSSGSAVTLASNSAQFQNNPYSTANSSSVLVVGTKGAGTPTVTFNTQQGNAIGGPATATGALTLGGGTSMPTSLGAGGTYYWKLDLTNGGAGATPTPGNATTSPGSTAGAPAAGAAWDELILDNLGLNSTIATNTTPGAGGGTGTAFTIQATSFTSGTTVTGGSAVTTVPAGTPLAGNYSWVIARVNQVYSAGNAASLLAGLSLDTSGMPNTAPGYNYFLTSQQDPGNASATDLVINYAPVPEPTGLSLLGLGAGAALLRRRRRSACRA